MNRDHVESSIIRAGRAPKIDINSIEYPESELCEQVLSFAKKELEPDLFNHAQRIFLYGNLLLKGYPLIRWKTVDVEKYFIACMLHHIALAPSFRETNSMSYENGSGIIAHSFIMSNSSRKDVADDVAEAIIRHSMDSGCLLSPLCMLLQLTTDLDLCAKGINYYHGESVHDIVMRFPIGYFNSYFLGLMNAEVAKKPWCYTTHKARIHDWINQVRTTNLLIHYGYTYKQ